MAFTVLQRDFGGRPIPVRIRLSTGVTVLPYTPDPTGSPYVGEAQIDETEVASIEQMLGLGWEITAFDPGASGDKVFRGTHDALLTYRSGDVVRAGGLDYQASTQTSNTPPHADWNRVSVEPGPAAVVHTGATAPPATFGLEGEFWFNTAGAGALYLRSGGAWTGYSLGGGGGGGITDGDKTDITVADLGSTWTIDPGAVTLAKMANLSSLRFIGRITGGSGVPEALTVAQATSMLNEFDASNKGLAPAHGGGGTKILTSAGWELRNDYFGGGGY